MAKTLHCAFNVTRQAFLSLGVTIAETPFARMRGLLGQPRLRSGEAVWFLPSHGIHTIGLRSPVDVLYLDSNRRIVSLIDNLAPLHIPMFRRNCASVLLLPVRTVFDSGTQIGDQLLINSVEELSGYWESQRRVQSKSDPEIPVPPRAQDHTPESPGVSQWLFGEDLKRK